MGIRPYWAGNAHDFCSVCPRHFIINDCFGCLLRCQDAMGLGARTRWDELPSDAPSNGLGVSSSMEAPTMLQGASMDSPVRGDANKITIQYSSG